MIFVFALIGFLGLVIAIIKMLPDLSRFIWAKTKEIRFPNEFVDFSSITVTLFFTAIITITGLIFYKFSVALVAYFLSDGLISFFDMLRGVFSIIKRAPDPFVFQHFMSGLILTPAIQFLAVYLVSNGIRKFMTEMNKKYGNPPSYNESDAFYFGFIAIITFVLLDLVLYSQSIPTVSQIAHLVFLGLSKVALILFYLSVSHVKLLKLEEYRNSILNSVEMQPKVQSVVFTPRLTILTTYLIALTLQFPFFSGTQFLDNNWLIGGILILVCGVGYLLLRFLLARGFNYLGVIMLVEGPSELGPAMNVLKPEKQKKFLYFIMTLGLLFFILKLKLFLFSVTLLLLGLAILLLMLTFTYFSGFGIGVVRARMKGYDLPSIQYSAILSYLSQSATSFLKGGILMISVIFLIFSFLTFFPKTFEYDNDSLVNAVFDKDGNLLYQDHQNGNPCIPINYSEVPPFLIKCLILQEDRMFFQQNGWLPNKSNWHGFSMAIFYRYFSGGGGSNLNQQLIKNMALDGRKATDIQRKFAELLTSYQLSIQCKPEEIITYYLNEVSFNGGRGHSGLTNASLHTFGRQVKELNSLEMMYLVATLPRGSSFKTKSGYINYSDIHYFSEEVKSALLAKANSWYDQHLISKQEYNSLKNHDLGFTKDWTMPKQMATTNALLRKEIAHENRKTTKYTSALSKDKQIQLKHAVNSFKSIFNNKMSLSGFDLYSAAVVVDIQSGNIIGHFGGDGVADLGAFGTGNPLGSLIKPFLLIQFLEDGWKFEDVRLYDGKRKDKYTPNNYSGRYSCKYVGINEILGPSLNAPMVDIREYYNPIELFSKVEQKFTEMGIAPDPYLDLLNNNKVGEFEVNYPLGSRNMTLVDIAQMYQTLLNHGEYVELQVFTKALDLESNQEKAILPKRLQVFDKDNANAIKEALRYTMKPGGTGTHLLSILPSGKEYYAKTGTSDNSQHGYTVLSDGNILIVSWVSYCNVVDGDLRCNNTPPIPHESGARSAGILAALIYNHISRRNL